jgi:hypothetical protein
VAPQCREIWQRYSARPGARASQRLFYSELQGRGYLPNKNCEQLGAFEQPGPTWSRLLFIKTGLVPEPRYWWDAPKNEARLLAAAPLFLIEQRGKS